MATTSPRALAAVLLLLVGSTRCSNDNLVCVAAGCKPPTPIVQDDLVALSGQFCTTSPDLVTYPYKVLFVVDVSGSTAQSDPTSGRGPAVAAAIAQFVNNPQVSFAIMTFDSQANTDIPRFTRDPAILASGIPPLNANRNATNYVDALRMARDIIDQDAASLDPAEAARTRYDVQWLSDGVPNPCEQIPAVPGDEQALLDLVKSRHLLGMKLSTIFLTGARDAPCSAQFPIGAGPLMQQMATQGGGTFQALTGTTIKFNINITSTVQPFDNHLFYLVNESRVIKGARAVADSDHDGLADEDEVTLGTDPLNADASGSGCNDMTNQKLLPNIDTCKVTCAASVSPLASPTAASYADTDADGLHDCEEQQLGSNASRADSDGDYLMDGLELHFGTNFNDAATVTADTDRDGVTDAEEVMTGTNPLIADPNRYYAYTYTPLSAAPSSTAGVNCYNFAVANVHLVETQATATSAAGDNQLCLYTVQLPQSSSGLISQPTISRSCTTANLKNQNGNLLKTPADGAIEINLNSFTPTICASAACK